MTVISLPPHNGNGRRIRRYIDLLDKVIGYRLEAQRACGPDADLTYLDGQIAEIKRVIDGR